MPKVSIAPMKWAKRQIARAVKSALNASSHLHALHSLHRALARRADSHDPELDLDRPCMFETKRRLDVCALGQRMGEMGEHQVIAAGREDDRAMGGNGQSVLELAHLRDAVLRAHLMDFDLGEIRRSSGQTVGRRALVFDGQVAAANLGALRGRARPRVFDHDVRGLELFSERGRGADGKSERQWEKAMFHHPSFAVADLLRAHGFTVNWKVPWVWWVSTDTARQ